MKRDPDLLVVGAGPAGSAAAIAAARRGVSVTILDRSEFPRHKVCGDCVNPSAWPVLTRLGAVGRVRARPHVVLETVRFETVRGGRISVALPPGAEIAMTRSDLDEALLETAREAGAEVWTGCPVTRVARGWQVETPRGILRSRHLVAADGRNSSVLRMLGLLPPTRKDRVAIQAHVKAPEGIGREVALILRPEGYCGLATLPDGLMNVCLVARAGDLDAIRLWAGAQIPGCAGAEWRSITPLSRAAVTAAADGLWIAGDAARVVEPFTGEGIYYAMASGELAGTAVAEGWTAARYRAAHRALYRGRLWVNRLARWAVLYPGMATRVLEALGHRPGALKYLTGKIVAHGGPG